MGESRITGFAKNRPRVLPEGLLWRNPFSSTKISNTKKGANMDQVDNINLESADSFKPPTYFQMIFSQMIRDIKFVGMFVIIMGAINCLSIIGAVIGIPYIFIGMRMRESADQFDIFRMNNDARAMRAGFELQAKYFKIIKILIIISIVLMVLGIILFFALLIPLLSSLYEMQQYGS